MLVFGFALVAGLLLAGEWRLFRSKWIWMGGLIALAIFLPNLVWEARHGWPQIEVVRNAQQFKNVHVGVLEFLFEQILFLHPLALPVWLGGLAWLLFSKDREAVSFSRLGLSDRARDFYCDGWENILRSARLSAADGGGRSRVRKLCAVGHCCAGVWHLLIRCC